MAITIICKKGRSDVKQTRVSVPCRVPKDLSKHEMAEYARKDAEYSKAKRARGSSKRPEIERIGTMPLKAHLEMRKQGITPTPEVLRDMGALYRDVDV